MAASITAVRAVPWRPVDVAQAAATLTVSVDTARPVSESTQNGDDLGAHERLPGAAPDPPAVQLERRDRADARSRARWRRRPGWRWADEHAEHA